MAAPKRLTAGQRLRASAEQLMELAERADIPPVSLVALQRLHNDIEEVAGDVRAVVRGRSGG